MAAERHPVGRYLSTSLAVLALLAATACGSKVLRGEAPMVRLNELSQQDSTTRLQLSMHNLNGVDLNITDMEFKLTSGETPLLSYEGPASMNIVANGTETWSVDITANETFDGLLGNLQNGEIKSLPYTLKGSIVTRDEGTMHFDYEGHIYPVPGRPGNFR